MKGGGDHKMVTRKNMEDGKVDSHVWGKKSDLKREKCGKIWKEKGGGKGHLNGVRYAKWWGRGPNEGKTRGITFQRTRNLETWGGLKGGWEEYTHMERVSFGGEDSLIKKKDKKKKNVKALGVRRIWRNKK